MTRHENNNRSQSSTTLNDGLSTTTITTANSLHEEDHASQHCGSAITPTDESRSDQNYSGSIGGARLTKTDTRIEKSSTSPPSGNPATVHTTTLSECPAEIEKFWEEVVETLGYEWIENRLATEQKGTAITLIKQKEKSSKTRLLSFRTLCMILIFLVFFLVSFVVSVGYTTRWILRGGFNPCPTCS